MRNDQVLIDAKRNILQEMTRSDWRPANIRKIVKGLTRDVSFDFNYQVNDNRLVVEKLIRTVCRITHVSKNSLFSDNRIRPISYARHLVMYILVKDYRFTFEAAGKVLNRDHSTAIYAERKITSWIEINDKQTIEDLEIIRERLSNRYEK